MTVLSPVRLTVRVHPRASHPRRVWDGSRLELWIRQPPVDGAANSATTEAVADWLGLPRRAVRIVTGQTARSKVVEIEGAVVLPPPDSAV